MEPFTAGKKEILFFPAEKADRPLIIYHDLPDIARTVWDALHEEACPDFNLLTVGNLDFLYDMSPWPCGFLEQNGQSTGGADVYLRSLVEHIIPAALERIKGAPQFIGLGGYSLAGLFAVYAMYRTDRFDRIASMSGSLWYPGFEEMATTETVRNAPERMYFSLGDREARTRNEYMATVQDKTERLVAFYKEAGIDVTFELNKGNHFKHILARSVKGIRAILREEKSAAGREYL